MSPCSQDLDTTCCCMHLVISSDDTSVLKIPFVCEANVAGPLQPCQAVILPNCLHKESSFTTASEIDLAKMDLFPPPSCQSGHSCSTIMISIGTCVHQMSQGRRLWLSLKPCLLSPSEKRKKLLQREMTMFFGNPTKRHEQHKCEMNEHPEREIGEHHEPEIGGHHEPEIGGHHEPEIGGHHEPEIGGHHEPEIGGHHEPEIGGHHEPEIGGNNEFTNDSGYGSTMWHDCAVLDDRNDLHNLKINSEELSQCCFYYVSIDSQTSSYLLRNKPTGTFLLRDSSDPRYLYSLSVKTDKGATSIRILYSNGFFQFDSDERIRHKLPRFETVLALINFHVKATEEGGNKLWRWEQVSGCKSLKVVLVVPLKKSVPSLGHLARVQINKCMNNLECPKLSIDKLPLEFDCLKETLRKYPHQI